MFTPEDRHWMGMALDEARLAFEAGDYPVGAVLTIDGQYFASGRNALFSDGLTTSHAEHKLIAAHSAYLRELLLTSPAMPQLCLYTTLDPCLMCLGISVLHRVSRIVVACPDPNGGTAGLDFRSLGSFYETRWPRIEVGLYRERSCELIEQFLLTQKFRTWETMLGEFRQMRASWALAAS